MARAKKVKDEIDDNGGVVKPIDAERAKSIILNDILRDRSESGVVNQRLSTATKMITKECNIPSWVLNLVLKLKNTEDFKRDHELRAFNMLMSAFGLGVISADMVDMAEGRGDVPVVPVVGRGRPKLVAVNPPARAEPEMSDGIDADLADGADDVPPITDGQWKDIARKQNKAMKEAGAAGNEEPDDNEGGPDDYDDDGYASDDDEFFDVAKKAVAAE